MESKLLWWGYLHTQETIHLKRYFSWEDLKDAEESPFVKTYSAPFEAADKEEALIILKEKLGLASS